ncbi:MAG: hypothetical protein KatS3mg083_116 [Candidatus Dojkabacteria bacterium]|nr:MAG: hypothetical protein KatS3mg083_116 [Candidatus Dojkabacteria bacterium]
MIRNAQYYIKLVRNLLDDEDKPNVAGTFWSDVEIAVELDNAQYEVINYLYANKLYNYLQGLIKHIDIDLRYVPLVTTGYYEYTELPNDFLHALSAGFIYTYGLQNDYNYNLPILRKIDIQWNDVADPYTFGSKSTHAISISGDGIMRIYRDSYDNTTDPHMVRLVYVRKPDLFMNNLDNYGELINYNPIIYDAIAFLASAFLMIKDNMEGKKFYSLYSQSLLTLSLVAKQKDYFAIFSK